MSIVMIWLTTLYVGFDVQKVAQFIGTLVLSFEVFFNGPIENYQTGFGQVIN